MKYKITIKLDEEEIKAEIIANNWQEVCNYVFGRIEIIPENEKDFDTINIDEI